MSYKSKNNAFSTLASSVLIADTSLTVQAGHGDRFPVVVAPDYTIITLEDTGGNREIVKVTARAAAADTMTIVRAQEGTTARNWVSGDTVSLRITAAMMEEAINTANEAINTANEAINTANDHIADTTDAHAASAITNTPSGNLTANNVQAALNELDSEKHPLMSSASQAEMEAGTEVALRAMSPINIAQAIAALTPPNEGSLIGVQRFTSSGTYTKATNNPSFVIVEVVGGGGGGEGVTGSTATYGDGGGGGGYSSSLIQASSLAASVTVTVGDGGLGGVSGNAAGNGEASSFGNSVTATGGRGVSINIQERATGGTGSGGSIYNGRGGAGERAGSNFTGAGGSTRLSGGATRPSEANTGNGAPGQQNTGEGGSGAYASGGTARTGGNGGSGIVIVWEYR